MTASQGREHRRIYHLDGKAYRVSRHALDRMLDMQVKPDSVRAALTDPSQVLDHASASGTRTAYCHGRIVLILDKDKTTGGTVIVTCLWRDSKRWIKDLDRGEYEGRKMRITDYSKKTFDQLLKETP